jgi:hypothetical protein
MSILPFVNP